jgi:biopolymer transport protein ExbD
VDVNGSGLIVPGGGADAPIGHFRAALLVTALTLIAVFLPFLTIHYPPRLHKVMIDVRAEPGYGAAAGPYHRLEVLADGRRILDGRRAADLIELRMGLDYITANPESRVELRADPKARYESFLETLAVIERAGVVHLRVVGEGWSAPEAQGPMLE